MFASTILVWVWIVIAKFFITQVTGGAGFVGSHLVDNLMVAGHEVTVIDNFFTGRKQNVMHWIGHPNFELINHDVVNPIFIEGKLNIPFVVLQYSYEVFHLSYHVFSTIQLLVLYVKLFKQNNF